MAKPECLSQFPCFCLEFDQLASVRREESPETPETGGRATAWKVSLLGGDSWMFARFLGCFTMFYHPISCLSIFFSMFCPVGGERNQEKHV